MEEEKIEWEDVNLNSNPADDTPPAKTTFTLEEVEAMKKELSSNHEKWVQKVIAEKKLAERIIDEIDLIANDWTRLIELYEWDEHDKQIAQKILEKYKYNSIEEYQEKIWYTEDYTDPKLIQKKIKDEAKMIAESEKIESKKTEFISKLKMTDEEQKLFEEQFEELRWLKSFDSKDLNKQFEKAYRLSNDNTESLKKLQESEIIWKSMTLWEGKNTNSGKTKKMTNSEYNKKFLQERWIL